MIYNSLLMTPFHITCCTFNNNNSLCTCIDLLQVCNCTLKIEHYITYNTVQTTKESFENQVKIHPVSEVALSELLRDIFSLLTQCVTNINQVLGTTVEDIL